MKKEQEMIGDAIADYAGAYSAWRPKVKKQVSAKVVEKAVELPPLEVNDE
jgi:hypothetical protein